MGHNYVIVMAIDCTKDNLGCPGCPELMVAQLRHLTAIPDNPATHQRRSKH